ncbi:MAG: NADH-quinone oxidoreductase subunit L [Chloroflexi bacterium]|nr:NADH-quinone oxidoreductase subunit L [Chloroflexota bacterium]
MVGILSFLLISIPWLGALLVWQTGDSRSKIQHLLAAGFSIAAGIISLILLAFTSAETALVIPVGGVFGEMTLVADGLGASLAAVACVVGSLAVLFSVDYMRGEAQLGRYYTFVLIFIGAMTGLVLSGNLLFTFFFWEITALCSYALISFYNDDPKAVAGGLKALIITQVGGVGLLAGTLVAYANLGSLQVTDLLKNAASIPAGALAFVAFGFLLAVAAKSAQFPFHTWLPDAMEAPTPVSALIHAATMVNAGVYLLARFYPAFVQVPGWAQTVMLVGMISALLTALMALTATDLKRALAYSTVSQLGYMVYAIGVGGFFASQFHLLSHAVFKALLFLSAGAVIHAVGTRDMRKMGGLGQKMPFIRNVFIVGALALAGIPIFNGFWSKELILEAGLKQGPIWAYGFMVLGAGLTAFYTIRMTWLVFFGNERSSLHVHEIGIYMRVATTLLAFGTICTWLLAGPFSQMLSRSLPFHEMEVVSTLQVAEEVLFAPATWLALVVIAGGAGVWMLRQRFSKQEQGSGWFDALIESSFGFESFNRQIVVWVRNASAFLQKTQTGQLNWNILGIIGALLVVLAILAWGS